MHKTNLCTLFDSAYLAKGLALLRSIRRHLVGYGRVYVLALDDLTFEAISELTHKPGYRGWLEVRPLRSIERPLLLEAKARRTRREYIFTLAPVWTDYLLTTAGLDDLAYIDADCWLMADLAPLYAEVENASIGIIPHRWTPKYADRLRVNGIYNVSWVYFRHDDSGMACLAEWVGECLNYRGEPGKFSDQVYLDNWPARYGERCRIIEHRGANVAPWNQERYRYFIKADGLALYEPSAGSAAADAAMGISAPPLYPVLFFHFHELRQRPDGTIYRTGYPLAPDVAEFIYKPYEAALVQDA